MNANLGCFGCFLLLAMPLAVEAQFTVTTNNGALTITGYTGPGGDVVLPTTIYELPVVGIAEMAFSNILSLTSMMIQEPVTNIGPSAFHHCTSLMSVAIPSSVTTIGGNAFRLCTGLISVAIPASVTNIGAGAFESCHSLTAISVDPSNPRYSTADGVLFSLDRSLLIQCPGGKTDAYAIPPGVTLIGSSAFFGCRRLTSVTLAASVTTIEFAAFVGCYGLTNITIPEGVTSIGHLAFVSCISLTNLTIPGSVTNIGSVAFSQSQRLKAIVFLGNAPTLFDSLGNIPATIYYMPGATGWGGTFGGRPAYLWNPSLRARSYRWNPQFPSYRVGVIVEGTTNMPIVVEASTNLAGGGWVTVMSCTLTNGIIGYGDVDSFRNPARFYRVRSP